MIYCIFKFCAFSPPKVKAQMNFVLIVDGWPMTVNTPRRIPASSVSSVFELFTTTSMEIKLGTFRHSDTLTKVLSYENCVSKTTLCISIVISVKAGWFNMLTTAEQLSSSFSVANMLTRRSYQLCKWFLELCFIDNMFAPIKVIQLFIDDGQIKPFTDTHISSVLSDILPCRSGEFLYTLPPTCNYYYHIIHVLNGHSSFKANMNLYGLHDFFYIVHHLLWILNKYCVCIMSHFLFFAQIHRRTFNSVCLNFEFHLFWISFEISSVFKLNTFCTNMHLSLIPMTFFQARRVLKIQRPQKKLYMSATNFRCNKIEGVPVWWCFFTSDVKL